MGRRAASIATTLGAVLLLTGCSAPAGDPDEAVSVVATTTIWGDITGEVVDCVGTGSVTTLLPIGADPHDYAPSSQDIVSTVTSDLVVANGLGLEEGLDDSLRAARADGAAVFEVAEALDPLPFDGQAGHSESTEDIDHEGDDPHVWLDAQRAARGAALIGTRLTEVTGDEAYADCGRQVQADLLAVDDEVTRLLAPIEASDRVLVTDHDALGYFAAAYGFQIAGTVVPGGSTLAEPSSEELADLARTIREAGVPAVFANTANPDALVSALADEVGDVDVVDLYIGSLGEPDGSAGTYAGLMITNAQRISDALAGSATDVIEWFAEPFSLGFQQRALLGGILAGLMCSVVGTWLVLRGMSFFGDAFTHGVVPGIAAAVALEVNPLLGAAVAAAVMLLLIEVVSRGSRLTQDTAIGLLFVGMLALGVMIISRVDSYTGSLTSILFGNPLAVTRTNLAWQLGLATVVVVASLLLYRPLLTLSFNEQKAELLGMHPRAAHAALLVLIATAVIGSFQSVGTLLVFGLLVGPPATAALVARTVPRMMLGAAGLAVVSVWLGLVISYHFGTAASASMALIPILLFFLVLPVSHVRGSRQSNRDPVADVPADASP